MRRPCLPLLTLYVMTLSTSAAFAVPVTLRLVDQSGTDIPASRVLFENSVGASVEFDAGGLVDLPEGTYTAHLRPGINGRVNAGVLVRSESNVMVTSGTTELRFEWIVRHGLVLSLDDQHGVPIPASQLDLQDIVSSGNLFGTFFNGATVSLPISDASIYPTLCRPVAASACQFGNGYDFFLKPGINGIAQRTELSRAEFDVVVTPATPEIRFTWVVTAGIRLSLEDQHGVPIPASQMDLQDFVASSNLYGTFFNVAIVSLPITDITVYPTLCQPSGASLCQFGNGYDFVLKPGINGIAQRTELSRFDQNFVVTSATTQFRFEWAVKSIALDVLDQNGVPIPGSEVVLHDAIASGNTYGSFLNAQSVVLPVTDPSVYPTVCQPTGPSLCQFGNGYDFLVFPGVNGVLQRPHLSRFDPDRGVGLASAGFSFEWIASRCALRVVDSSEVEIPGSVFTFLEIPGRPSYGTGAAAILPITDETVYPSLSGDIANGYDIEVTPGNLGGARGTFPFEILPGNVVSPAFVSIGGVGVGLRCSVQPVVDIDGDGFSTPQDCDDSNASINPGTFETPGNTVDENCDGVKSCDSAGTYRNHGQFVRCVAHACEALIASGKLTQEQCDAIVAQAAQSNVGKP